MSAEHKNVSFPEGYQLRLPGRFYNCTFGEGCELPSNSYFYECAFAENCDFVNQCHFEDCQFNGPLPNPDVNTVTGCRRNFYLNK